MISCGGYRDGGGREFAGVDRGEGEGEGAWTGVCEDCEFFEVFVGICFSAWVYFARSQPGGG
jgi:hypothetical protein